MNLNRYHTNWSCLTLVVCLCVSLCQAAEPAQVELPEHLQDYRTTPPKPSTIPAGPDAPTGEIYTKAERAMKKRQVLGAYKSLGHRDRAWDKTAIDLLTMAAKRKYLPPSQARPERFVELGKAAIDAGCDDPMVAYWYGYGLENTKKERQALELWPKTIESFKASKYPPAYLAMSWGHYRKMLQKNDQAEKADSIKPQVIEAFLVELASGEIKGTEQRIVLQHLLYELRGFSSQERLDMYKAYEDKYKTDNWIFHVLAGMAHKTLAWKARGGGWGNTVTDEGWKGFAEHLALARKHFMRAWEMDPTLPEPAHQMIAVAMAGHAIEGQTPRFWFDKAVSAQLDYIPAYSSLRWATRPRWGGSHEEMYAFGLECAATKRYDTWVPAQLFWAVCNVAEDMDYDWLAVFARPGLYENVQSMLDDYAQAKNSRPGRNWALSVKVAVAWRAGKLDDASKALDVVGKNLRSSAFKNVKGKMDQAVHEIKTATEKAEKTAPDPK